MKKTIIVILIAVLSVSSVFAANVMYYEKGDSEFTVKAGLSIPSFMFFSKDSDAKLLKGTADMHLKTGGVAAISYQSFVNQKWAVGGELGYYFNYSNSKDLYTEVPFSVKLSYVPVQNGKFDLNCNINAGLALLKYDSERFLSPLHVSLTLNPVYFFGLSWGIGVEAGIYANVEKYSNAKIKDSCIAGFTPIALTLTYRH